MKPLDLLTVLASIGCAAELKVASEIEEEQSPITWSECSQAIGDHPCELALTSQEEETWSTLKISEIKMSTCSIKGIRMYLDVIFEKLYQYFEKIHVITFLYCCTKLLS